MRKLDTTEHATDFNRPSLDYIDAKNASLATAQDRLFQFGLDGFSQQCRVGFFLPSQSTITEGRRSQALLDQGTGAGFRFVYNANSAGLFVIFGLFNPFLLDQIQKALDVNLVLVSKSAVILRTGAPESLKNFLSGRLVKSIVQYAHQLGKTFLAGVYLPLQCVHFWIVRVGESH